MTYSDIHDKHLIIGDTEHITSFLIVFLAEHCIERAGGKTACLQ